MASIATHFSSTFDVHDAFLLGKMDINHGRKNKVKTNDLKFGRKPQIILKEEFRFEVREMLNT
jgi:hypothetical protein